MLTKIYYFVMQCFYLYWFVITNFVITYKCKAIDKIFLFFFLQYVFIQKRHSVILRIHEKTIDKNTNRNVIENRVSEL